MPDSKSSRIDAVEQLAMDAVDLAAQVGASADRTNEVFLYVLKVQAGRIIELEQRLTALELRTP